MLDMLPQNSLILNPDSLTSQDSLICSRWNASPCGNARTLFQTPLPTRLSGV